MAQPLIIRSESWELPGATGSFLNLEENRVLAEAIGHFSSKHGGKEKVGLKMFFLADPDLLQLGLNLRRAS